MLWVVTLAMIGGAVTGADNRPDGSSLSKALDRLTATEDALDRARLEYRKARDGQNLDASETKDFKGFIVALDRQVQAACDQVRRLGGDLAGHAAYCAEAGDPGAAPVPGTASTRTEVAAEIDGELDAAVGEFDEMLLREQRSLAQHAQSNSQSNSQTGDQGDGSSGGGGTGSSGDRANAGERDAGTSGTARQAQGSGQWSDPRTGAAGGIGESGRRDAGGTQRAGDRSVGPGTGGVPADIDSDVPDGRDDDVVARQLREAAMKEQDPELRRRLWEEYKRYKQGQESNQ